MENLGKDFRNYATKHLNISGNTVDSLLKGGVENSLTPYILEERQLNVSTLDIFSRLLYDRQIFLTGVVDQRMADFTQAQLLYLESVDNSKDITFIINSGGGSVMAGLSILDTMNYIKPDIATLNAGLCASMASVLVSGGTKGKRSSLISSRVMLHHVSAGNQGVIDEMRVSMMETEKYNFLLFKILAENCGKTFEQVHNDSMRDAWFNSKEALDYGLIDEIIGTEKSKPIDEMMDGFEDYYKQYVIPKLKM